MSTDKSQKLAVRTLLGLHPVTKIGTIEAGYVTTWSPQPKLFDDVVLYAPGGGSGQGHQRYLRKQVAQPGQLPVLRTKIMTPFTDAMGLVYRDQVYGPFLQICQEAWEHQTLRRDVQQAVLILAQSEHAGSHFIGFQGGIEKRRRHAARGERINLILHQRNQRRDDHC